MAGACPEENHNLYDPSLVDWPPIQYFRLEGLLALDPHIAAPEPTTGELFTPPDSCSTIPKEHFYADD